jgi:hypothetical protein
MAMVTTEAPKRIQRKRTKGWRMPEGAVYVGRGTIFGNPFPINGIQDRAMALERYTNMLFDRGEEGRVMDLYRQRLLVNLHRIQGKDVACWCPLCAAHADGLPMGVSCEACPPCHADVLLAIANR